MFVNSQYKPACTDTPTQFFIKVDELWYTQLYAL